MSFKHKQYSYYSFQHEILLALQAIYHHNPNTGPTCSLINMVVNGRTPLAVRTTLFGASLGGGVRPITVGPTLRCVAAKSLCCRVLQLVGASVSSRVRIWHSQGSRGCCTCYSSKTLQKTTSLNFTSRMSYAKIAHSREYTCNGIN